MQSTLQALCSGAALALVALPAQGQWNPATGQWGKTDPSDLRVITWNVQDGLCSTNAKVEGQNNWCALARIVAALKPDVLVLEECADNSGNGTGSGVDTVAELTTVLDQFLHGGLDSFNGNTPITAWVQKYAPGYDLPYVFVPSENDGFNRNCILSRHPFADLNGDTRATYADIPNVMAASGWAPGGDGGIRGFQFAELNLPDATYLGNAVMGFAHLKAGGTGTDHDQRIAAAQNVSYFVRYFYNGNGGAVPDPNARIADSPVATSVLGATTPVILGGDWNEDEWTNGTKGPAEWLTLAQTTGGTTDGTDRDGTDATFDNALHFSTGSDASHNSGAKYDYIAWQDSIATLRLSTIFISGSNAAAAQPPELAGFTGGASSCSSTASDHRPVLVDLRLPIRDCDADGIADTTEIAANPLLDQDNDLVLDACEVPGTEFCSGEFDDPTHLTPCPCANFGSAGHGCAHSFSADGARIAGSGTPNPDTVLLTSSNLPSTSFALFMQHDALGDQTFHDGVLCASGNLIRLRGRNAVGGVATFPNTTFPNDATLTLSQRGQVTPGSGARRYYAVWYRNASTTFCPPATANVTNGHFIDW